jgi:NhaA family Na+:H+ antiporter
MIDKIQIKNKKSRSPANGLKTIFQEFFQLEAAGGIILIVMTLAALILANSSQSDAFFALWETKLTFGLGSWQLSKPIILWINDGLMAVFFFVVGLEIKREVLAGDLASPRRAALPLAAALGGMLVPALLYVVPNLGQESLGGWGVPMATDIAFSLGVLALLGTRAPLTLKIFLTALAIVDDIGAVLVIAIFYTSEIAWSSLAMGVLAFVFLVVLNRAHVTRPWPYALLGVGLWLALLYSGVHATIAGVLVAITIPARARVDVGSFLSRSRQALQTYEDACCDEGAVAEKAKQAAARILELAGESVESPLQRLEHSLHPWVIYAIMPIFALANAGVALSGGDFASALTSPVALGIIIGLALGKPLGIVGFSWLAIRLGLAELPSDLRMRHLAGAGFLAGIGFTMSLFIANLAFPGSPVLNNAKIGVLLASLVSGLMGTAILVTTSRPKTANARQPASAMINAYENTSG